VNKTRLQVTDQTLKGALIGVATYLFAQGNMDPGLQAALIPVLTAVLAFVSTRVGDKGVASFFTVAKKVDVEALMQVIDRVQDLPKLPDVKESPAPAPEKKPAAKKPAAKKPAAEKK
jgi:hypothetical protein